MEKPWKIYICVPTAGTVPMPFAYSLAGMVANFAASAASGPVIPERPVTLSLKVIESSNWITNREKLARNAIDDPECTHLMWLDDDMSFDPGILNVLLSRRQDIVVTNYLIKTEEKDSFVAISLDKKRMPTRECDTGIVPITYSGFGVSLISAEVFRKVPQPWFMPRFLPEVSEYTTEDNPFFALAREAGYTVYLDHDASKMLRHIGRRAWDWREFKPQQANTTHALSVVPKEVANG